MKRNCITSILLFILGGVQLWACSSVTPKFTYVNNHSCGIPGKIALTNTSTGTSASSSNTKYYWKLNNVIVDSTVGLASPNSMLLTNVGNHDLKVIVKDSTGCVDSSSTTATVTSKAPKVYDQYGASTYAPSWLNCIVYRADPDSFEIKVSSAVDLKSFSVIWGDGAQDTGIAKLIAGDSLKHFYTQTGIYIYKIVLYDSATSCRDTLYGKVINQRQPTAGISGPTAGSNRGCAPHTVQFKNTSYNVTSETLITWDFGDGKRLETSATGVADSVKHTYTEALCGGIVTLIATNACGTSQTTWNPIDISEKDKAQIGVDTTNCDPKVPFVFYNNTADLYCINPDPKEYYWDFGDGTTTGWIKSKAEQTHVYSNDGVYTVMLVAKNNCGKDTTYFTFTAVFTPRPNFILVDTAGCAPVNVKVTDISKGWKVTRNWDFGDGNTSTDSTKTNTYVTGGVYTLKLTATNSCGSKDTTKTIQVYNNPKAKFGLRGEGCIGYKQSFFNNSTIYTDSTTYAWDFGNGTTSTVKDPAQQTFNTAGNYKAILTVSNTCGTSKDTQDFTIYDYPKTTIVNDSVICTFDSFTAIVSSTIASSYSVNWGDGLSSNFTKAGSLKHVYTTAGNMLVEVKTTSNGGGCVVVDTVYVNVKPGALADFSLSKIYDCAPATFTITDLSKNSTNHWWYINDSLVSTSSTYNSFSINTDSTIKTIKLKTQNAGFCDVDSAIKTVFTPQKVTAKFVTNVVDGCGPLTVDFTDSSSNATTYNWSFNNGTISTISNPTATFNASLTKDSSYTVKLKAYNWAGCSDSVSNSIKVYPIPSINFSAPVMNGCGPLTINFTNSSSPKDTGSINIMNFKWDLGNGNVASSKNSTGNTYNASLTKDSSYAVKLIGYSEHGCADSLTKIVTVYPKPLAKFTLDKIDGCGPLSVVTNNLSSPNDTGSIAIMNFIWSYNNSTSTAVSPAIDFTASKTKDSVHSIKLKAFSEHGCVDSTTNTVRVYPKPIAKFTPSLDKGCAPHVVAFNNQSSPNDTGSIAIMTFDWSFGNAQSSTAVNPSTTYNSNGNVDSIYRVQLIAKSEHGCSDTSAQNITAYPKAIANFNLDKTAGCGPLTVNFTEKSINGQDYYWNFGSGFIKGNANESHVFQPILLFDTLYDIAFTVRTKNGCLGDTITKSIRVQGIPKAEFMLSKDSTCGEEVTLAYNTSLAAIKYNWDLGDGTTSTQINPSKTWLSDRATGKDKTYTITLIATSIFGCTDTTKRNLTVTPFPKAKIGFDKMAGCGDLSINFYNNSGFGSSQRWDFGDGTTSSSMAPSHIFTNITPQPKNFVVALIAMSSAGCSAMDTGTVTVHPKPFLNISATRVNICDDGEMEFISNNVNTNNTVWNFGDGSPVMNASTTGQNIKHQFPLSTYTDSNFVIKIKGISQYGCTDSVLKPITLGPKVYADFDQTPNSACVPAIASFTNLSRNATNYIWDFGDNAGSGDKNPTHVYNKGGKYNVTLSVFDKNGCKATKTGTNNFFARETPIAEFVMSPGTLKLPNAKAIFSNQSIYTQATSFAWDFGDGATSIEENPVHNYVDTGAFKVTLKAVNSTCQDVIIKQIIVDPSLPLVDFEPESAVGCAPLKVSFKEKSTFANTFTWYFGDGYTSTEANPTHLYENEGFFTVTLIAEGPGGVSRIIKKNIIEVKATPKCFFYATPDSAHLPNARFDMKNKTVNGSQFTWQVNNSETQALVLTSQLKEPSFIINQAGNYDVTLTAVNENQCYDSLTKPLMLIVLEEGKIYIPTAFTPNRDNRNDKFKAVTLGVSEKDYTFNIYNRWGEKVFTTNDLEGAWDGTINDKPVAEGVFIWTISGRFASGDFFERKGTVTLLK